MQNDSNPEKPVRQASTVILIREQAEKYTVYLMKRNTGSGFMGGLYVFPGGVVDPVDREASFWQNYMDMALEGPDREDVTGFIVAAIRETLEEAGVFLAKTDRKNQADFDRICEYRLKKTLSPEWFKNKVADGNWRLECIRLKKWSHWITPRMMKKRFDTRFFIVHMPDHQECRPDNRETMHGIWQAPLTALERNLTGEVPLSPPTVVTLTQLLEYPTFRELMAHIETRGWGPAIAPRMVSSPVGPVILEPWDPDHAGDGSVDTTDAARKVLPAGTPFSRIWCDNGIWKPIGL